METIKEALIKEALGADKVFIVENLPKELLFTSVRKQVLVPPHATDYDRTREKWVMDYTLRDEEVPDEPRNRKLTGAMVDELLPGIERSQTGDGGFVFFTGETEDSKNRLQAIDDYIKATLPPLSVIPKRVPYAAQVGSFTSGPKPLSMIPRVVLPVSVPPPVAAASQEAVVNAPVTGNQPILSKPEAPKKREWTPEQKKAAGDRLRAAKAAKEAAKG